MPDIRDTGYAQIVFKDPFEGLRVPTPEEYRRAERNYRRRLATAAARNEYQPVGMPFRGAPLRRCEFCREWFAPSRSDQRFHNATCRQRAYRARARRSGS